MRTKITGLGVPRAETTLNRLLDALEQELLQASDEEILEAARELGMQPGMKGSAAFLGVTYPTMPQLSDFFDLLTALPLEDARRLRLPSGLRDKKRSRDN